MKKYYYTIITILFFGLLSCSNEESKTQNQIAARPTLPLQNGEVQIGTQIWMTKNLNVSRYRNGDPIPQVANSAQWANLTTGAWCYYNNDPANGPIYGKLYNWYAVNDPRGLVPIGWHMPSSAEWNTVVDFLGGQAVAGIKMKTTTGWSLVPGFVSTNSSGFTGLPGGSRANEGTFYSIVANAYWWSSTSYFTDIAWMNYIGNNFDESYVSLRYKTNGLSVRCVKD